MKELPLPNFFSVAIKIYFPSSVDCELTQMLVKWVYRLSRDRIVWGASFFPIEIFAFRAFVGYPDDRQDSDL
jgi:hypothetical protein